MNQYKKLLGNTLIFAIGTFSSKVLVLFLVPLYTRVLSEEQLGIADLVVQSAGLLMPLVTCGIASAVIRFGLDKSYRKSDVFSAGFLTVLLGLVGLLVLSPLLRLIDLISDYTILLFFYVMMSVMRSLSAQFVRARGLVRLYAVDGVLSTALTIAFNLAFLLWLDFGIVGYVAATIAADFCSVLFLFVTAELRKYIKLKSFKRSVWREMLGYSLPMMPSTVFWWVTSTLDRYLLAYMLPDGRAINGLYSVAHKVPTIIMLVSSIFIDAWQMSAISEKDSKDRQKFYSTVFVHYQSLLFMAAAVLIPLSQLIMKYWVAPAYFPSWQYIPLLLLATVFSAFGTFFSSIFMAEKKTMIVLQTTVVGATINVLLNLYLIPKLGANGSSMATLICYFTVFAIRAVRAQRYVKVNISPIRMTADTAILMTQTTIMLFQPAGWWLYEVALVLLMIAIHLRELLGTLSKVLRHLPGRKKPAKSGESS